MKIIEKLILSQIKPLEFTEKNGVRIYKKLEPKTKPISEEIVGNLLNEEIKCLLTKT